MKNKQKQKQKKNFANPAEEGNTVKNSTQMTRKKLQHPNQEERRKEGYQILKDKQQVKKKRKKCSAQGPRTKKENRDVIKKKKG